MIHQLLHLTRSLFILDTETTGLTDDARIIELGFQQWTSEGMIKEWRSLINPEMPIPPAVTVIHGITDEMIKACQLCGKPFAQLQVLDCCACERPKIAPTFLQLATSLARGFHDCDYAGKNIRFDLRRLDFEMKRANVPWSYVGARIIDADRLEALAHPRDLGSMHEKYVGHKHDGAHGALSDVRAVATVIVQQLITHGGLSRDLDALHAAQWPGWLVADGSFRLVNGVPMVAFGKAHRDKPMKDVPVKYWDWMLGEKFPEDVKAIVRDAKLGKFPEVTPEVARAADRRMDV